MKIGDKIHDNDPRMGNRVLVIVDFHPEGGHVVAKSFGGRYFHILKRRIHSDGKPRRSGFTLEPKP